MYVFRMRAYAKYGSYTNSNCAPHKIEAVSEELAQRDAESATWIYFFVDLTAPEAL